MSDLNDPRVFFVAERTLMAWNRTGLTLMAFGFVLERFGLFLHVLRQDPGHAGRACRSGSASPSSHWRWSSSGFPSCSSGVC